jgi:Fe2+ or Zn2+ uptake regulation protein
MHEMEEHIFNDHGFTVSSGRTVIYGICQECSGASPKSGCTCCHSKAKAI